MLFLCSQHIWHSFYLMVYHIEIFELQFVYHSNSDKQVSIVKYNFTFLFTHFILEDLDNSNKKKTA